MGHNKSSFLKQAVEHIDITSFDARPIVDSMSKMSFVSRETANAAKIFNNMLSDKDCTIFLTLAGSTSAAGIDAGDGVEDGLVERERLEEA